jgi:hypothetical protein
VQRDEAAAVLAEARQCFAEERESLEQCLLVAKATMVEEREALEKEHEEALNSAENLSKNMLAAVEERRVIALRQAEERQAAVMHEAEERCRSVAQEAELRESMLAASAEEREAHLRDLRARFDARESRSEDIEVIARREQDINSYRKGLAERGFSLQQARLELKNRDLNDNIFSTGPRPLGGSKTSKRNRAASAGPRHDLPPAVPCVVDAGCAAVFRAPTALGGLPGKKVGDSSKFADRMRQTLRNSRDKLNETL